MDKIEKEFKNQRGFSFDGASSLIVVFRSGYHAGCKSCDDEIKKLKEDCRNLVQIINNQKD